MDFLKHDLTADAEADLRGLKRADALEKLASALDDSRILGHKTLLVRIDPATPTSGETLFQPVGRRLAEAKTSGHVSHCHPVMEEGCGGFLVVFKEETA